MLHCFLFSIVVLFIYLFDFSLLLCNEPVPIYPAVFTYMPRYFTLVCFLKLAISYFGKNEIERRIRKLGGNVMGMTNTNVAENY